MGPVVLLATRTTPNLEVSTQRKIVECGPEVAARGKNLPGPLATDPSAVADSDSDLEIITPKDRIVIKQPRLIEQPRQMG